MIISVSALLKTMKVKVISWHKKTVIYKTSKSINTWSRPTNHPHDSRTIVSHVNLEWPIPFQIFPLFPTFQYKLKLKRQKNRSSIGQHWEDKPARLRFSTNTETAMLSRTELSSTRFMSGEGAKRDVNIHNAVCRPKSGQDFSAEIWSSITGAGGVNSVPVWPYPPLHHLDGSLYQTWPSSELIS